MRTLIISECGINHNSNFDTALKLIEASINAGADLIKFQTYFGAFPEYQYLEFNQDQWQELFHYCMVMDKRWISTPFDEAAVDFLNECGQRIWKIPSNPAVVKNYALLRKIAQLENCEKVLLSTGISTDQEIRTILDIFKSKNVILMHCVSLYPTPLDKLNLNRISHLKKTFGVPVGFSDHSLSINAPLEAVKLGAIAIEKHITLSRAMDGPDHKASMLPSEFKLMVKNIRQYEKNN